MKGQQFEYAEVQYDFTNRPIIKKFVTVLDEFTHRYSGKVMRYCRIEYVSYVGEVDTVKYTVVDEIEFGRMLEARCDKKNTTPEE